MADQRTVAVTGAGGSLGKALTRRLVNHGHRVKALVRKESDADAMHGIGASPVIGDVRDADSLKELVGGCETVLSSCGLDGRNRSTKRSHIP